jgi:hypothetical protein
MPSNYEQSSNEGLGPLISEHSLSRVLPKILTWVAAAFCGLAFIAPGNGLGYLALIIFVLAIIFWAIVLYGPWRLWMFENGFRLRGVFKQEDVKWVDIQSGVAWYSVSIKPKTLMSVTFVVLSGKKISIPLNWTHRAKLAQHMDEVLARLPDIKKAAKAA